MRYSQSMPGKFTVLMGNHELLMYNSISGDMKALAAWMKLGGDATLISFGVSVSSFMKARPSGSSHPQAYD